MFFCRWLSPLFVFMGALFVANAVSTRSDARITSTLLNWGTGDARNRSVRPLGGKYFHAEGVLAGNMIGGVAFGIIATFSAYRLIASFGDKFKPQAEVIESGVA